MANLILRTAARHGRPLASSSCLSRPLSAAVSESTRGKYFGPLEVRDGVALVRLDVPEKMNTLNAGIMAEAQEMWAAHIENDPNVKAVVFISSKPDNFIAGADIQMIKTVANKDDLKDLCLNGHDFFDRLKKKVRVTFFILVHTGSIWWKTRGIGCV